MGSINAFDNLRQEVLYLYEMTSCDGLPSTRLNSLGKIWQMIEVAENKAIRRNAQIIRLTVENDELKRQIEALKQEKKTEKEEPAHKTTENTCNDLVKAVDDLVNSWLIAKGYFSGSEEKK